MCRCYIGNTTVKTVTTVGVFGLVFLFDVIMLGVTIRRVVSLHQIKEVRVITIIPLCYNPHPLSTFNIVKAIKNNSLRHSDALCHMDRLCQDPHCKITYLQPFCQD